MNSHSFAWLAEVHQELILVAALVAIAIGWVIFMHLENSQTAAVFGSSDPALATSNGLSTYILGQVQ